jgi:hypothetical protein
MNIVYTLNWRGNSSGGVALKVHDQLEAWTRLGNQVKILNICLTGSEIPEGNFKVVYFEYNSKFGRLISRWKASRYIFQDKSTDIYYRRYGLFLPFEILAMFLKPHVIELNTNNDFYYRQRGFIPWIWHKIQQKVVGKACLAGCAVTEEIQRLNENIYTQLATFTNGIDLTNRSQRNSPIKGRDRFVFLAGDNFSWNGFSKLESIASNLRDSDFYIVGNAKFSSPLENVFSIEYLKGQELSFFLASCTFGISTLALENTGLIEAAPLKNRTYLYYGLPIVGSSIDGGLKKNNDFFFQVKFDQNSNILNISELKDFCEVWRTKAIEAHHIDQIDINRIESLRVEFFKALSKKGNYQVDSI